MPTVVEPLKIFDVKLIVPKRFADSRGYFVETYTKRALVDAGIAIEFVQDNQSLSRTKGTVRGLHFQTAPEPQTKLVRVLAGSIFDVAVDLRQGSATYGQWCASTLTAEEGEQLLVPIGFAHAFCTLEPDTVVAYKVDGYYNREAEGGVRWDDPDIAIEWPVAKEEIVVSDKDAQLPRLRDVPQPIYFGH